MRRLLTLLVTLMPIAVQARTELPIKAVVISDGARRYSVTLTIDGRPIEAGLDTGSTGLRILAKAMPAEVAALAGPEEKYSYGSGVAFSGKGIRLPVAFGGGPAGDVRIQRIDRIGCTDRNPDCAGTRLSMADYRILGDALPGQGFDAILGLGLHADPVPNPLLALGVRRWIVDLPRPGEAEGRLVLDPDDAEIAAYREFKVIEGLDDRLPGCLVGPAALGRICGSVRFDSGAPGLKIVSADPPKPWPQGTPATLAVGDDKGMMSIDIVTGRREQATGFSVMRMADVRQTRIQPGIGPYFRWSVLYDSERHSIGLRER
jgi:hypothetical protein